VQWGTRKGGGSTYPRTLGGADSRPCRKSGKPLWKKKRGTGRGGEGTEVVGTRTLRWELLQTPRGSRQQHSVGKAYQLWRRKKGSHRGSRGRERAPLIGEQNKDKFTGKGVKGGAQERKKMRAQAEGRRMQRPLSNHKDVSNTEADQTAVVGFVGWTVYHWTRAERVRKLKQDFENSSRGITRGHDWRHWRSSGANG